MSINFYLLYCIQRADVYHRVNAILIDLAGGWEGTPQWAKITGYWMICMFIYLLLVNLIWGGLFDI